MESYWKGWAKESLQYFKPYCRKLILETLLWHKYCSPVEWGLFVVVVWGFFSLPTIWNTRSFSCWSWFLADWMIYVSNRKQLLLLCSDCVVVFRIPWFQYPIIYDIRARPRKISSLTGSKGQTLMCYKHHPVVLREYCTAGPHSAGRKIFRFIFI